MEEVPGIREGTRRYLYEGFAYHRDFRGNIYRCADRGSLRCCGQAKVEENRVVVIKEHDAHLPNPIIFQECSMRAELIAMTRNTWRSIHEIYHDVSTRYAQEVHDSVPFRSVKTNMERERARALPEVPASLLLLGMTLRDFVPMADLYRGTASGEDGNYALLFATAGMIERINNVNTIYLSRTIPVDVLRPIRRYKLMTIYIRLSEMAFPVMYIVSQGQSKALFVAVWQLIINLAPGLQNSVSTVVCPYVRIIITSIREIFQRTEITGCWYFYHEVLCKKWYQLGLTAAPKEVLWMALSLPLAPVLRFAEGLDCIQTAGDRIADQYPAILNFVHYLRTVWLPLSDLVSVARPSLSTNSMCERYDRCLVSKLGRPHRSLWAFFDQVNALIIENEGVWRDPPPIRHARSDLRELNRISYLQDRLSTGRLNIDEFLLTIFDHRRRSFIENLIQDGRGNWSLNGVDSETINRADILTADDVVADGIPPAVEVADQAVVAEQEQAEEAVAEIVDDAVRIEQNEGQLEGIGALAEENGAQPDGNNEVSAAVEGAAGIIRDINPLDIFIRPCVACLAERPCIVYHDCRHLAMCEACDQLLQVRSCPSCRAPIVSTTQIFFA